MVSSTSSQPKLLVIGAGPVGLNVARAVAASGATLAGVRDIDDRHGDTPVQELAGSRQIDPQMKVTVGEPGDPLQGIPGEVDTVIIAAASKLDAIDADVVAALEQDMNVVSTSERLAHDMMLGPEGKGIGQPLVGEWDALAMTNTVVAAGGNPGGIQDVIPIQRMRERGLVMLTQFSSERVRPIEPGTRQPFVDKNLVGQTRDPSALLSDTEGHQGLVQSGFLVAEFAGLDPAQCYSTVENRPVVADRPTTLERPGAGQPMRLDQGVVIGTEQEFKMFPPGVTAEQAGDAVPIIHLRWKAAVGVRAIDRGRGRGTGAEGEPVLVTWDLQPTYDAEVGTAANAVSSAIAMSSRRGARSGFILPTEMAGIAMLGNNRAA